MYLDERIGVTNGRDELRYEGLELALQIGRLGGVAQDVRKQTPRKKPGNVIKRLLSDSTIVGTGINKTPADTIMVRISMNRLLHKQQLSG